MTLETDMQRFCNTDLGQFKGTVDAGKHSVTAVTSALKQFGIIDEDTSRWLSVGTSALSTIASTAGALKGLQALYNAKNDAKAAEGGALTAVNVALGPWGWGKIALATAVTAAASATMYAVVNEIQVGDFDLSTASGINSMLGALGAVS